MKISILSLFTAVTVLFASCAGFQAGPLTDAAVTIGTAKLISNSSPEFKAERIVMLHAVADGLEGLAEGGVTRNAVTIVINLAARKFLKDDPEFAPLVSALVLGFFPETPPPDQEAKLVLLARRVAGNIRAGLPGNFASGK